MHLAESLDGYSWTPGSVTLVKGSVPTMVELPDGGMRIYFVDFSSVSAVKQLEGGSGGFRMEQNYPNPFKMNTSINFELPVQDYVTLKIYNLLGHEVVTLVNGTLPAGQHSAVWNAHNVPGGPYIWQINYVLHEKWYLSAMADIPFYQHFNGTQLGAGPGVTLVLSRVFNFGQ